MCLLFCAVRVNVTTCNILYLSLFYISSKGGGGGGVCVRVCVYIMPDLEKYTIKEHIPRVVFKYEGRT